MNVLITGSSTGFTQTLLAALLADPRVELAIGLDREQSEFDHERYVQVLLDLRLPLLARVLQNIQAVVHIAPALTDLERAAALTATRNLCELAHGAGVRALIFVSSAFIYDTQLDAGPMREEHARGAPSGCGPASSLQAMEDWLDEFERQHPKLRIVRLRPHWVVGRHSNSLLARVLAGHRTPRLPEPFPLLQCLHEQDLVQAILLALHGDVRGAFNLAGCEPITLPALHRQARWLRLPASPEHLVRYHGMDGGCVELLKRALVLDTTRARQELGWQPRYTTPRDILRAK